MTGDDVSKRLARMGSTVRAGWEEWWYVGYCNWDRRTWGGFATVAGDRLQQRTLENKTGGDWRSAWIR